MAKADTEPDSAIDHAYQEKIRKVGQECREQGDVFLPLAAEALGGWHFVAVGEVKKFGAPLAKQTGEEEGVVSSQLFQQLSLSLMKGNSAIFSNRIPDM